MIPLNPTLIPHTAPRANLKNVVEGKGYRITVLTSNLIRVETQNQNAFVDDATQSIWFRDLPEVKFSVEGNGNLVEIRTGKNVFVFSKIQKKIVEIVLDGKRIAHFSKGNLGGTNRTLDMRIGAVGIGKGLVSKSGVAVFKDDSMLLNEDGTVKKRRSSGNDFYYFAYGRDYRGALRAFFRIAGDVPLLPRYALGNWWSRYYAYTQEEYINLMNRFSQSDLPFTVATVDMDWHWVDINKQFGTDFKSEHFMQCAGWTGYSWNKDLFPDHREFLRVLHEKGLRVTLNVHPASGIRHFEDGYDAMASAVGIDPSTKKTVSFDLSDNQFINAYFDLLHRPYETEGVDFWWVDWQQGKHSSVPGLDPLWALNHYHFLDNSSAKRGLTLSRYAKTGSHRYPLGFSGDSVTYWKSLAFQPYFTSTAANVGYGWWSHDIGGHTFGVYEDELYLRWCQFGVFSPVNRLHSTSHDLQGKEPWKHSRTTEAIVGDFLRLRHRLIPYLYTMNYLSHTEGRPLCEPMYYSYPFEENAYKIKNEYLFGSELIVCPITRPVNKRLNMARADVWLPKGRYTDIFTGQIYTGDKIISMFRDWESIPVLAREGTILPLSDDGGNSVSNPEKMELYIYRGNGSFTLYEDDGETYAYRSGNFAKTTFTVSETGTEITFSISPVAFGQEDAKSLLPETRIYTATFKDIISCDAFLDGNPVLFDQQKVQITLSSDEKREIVLKNCVFATNGDSLENGRRILGRVQGSTVRKMLQYRGMGAIQDREEFLRMTATRFPKNVYLAVKENMEV